MFVDACRVDLKTDELMQDIIRSHFKQHTILAVTHRLDTILDFDWVLVMEDGSLIEIGSPRELLARRSAFKDLFDSSGTAILKEA